MREKEIISTGQEIRKCKVLKDLNNYLKAVPENSTLISFFKPPSTKTKQANNNFCVFWHPSF